MQRRVWSQEVCVSQPPEEEGAPARLDAFIPGICYAGGSACCLSDVHGNKATACCDPSPAALLPWTPCARWLQIGFQGWWPEPGSLEKAQRWGGGGLTSSPASSLWEAGWAARAQCNPALLPAQKQK